LGVLKIRWGHVDKVLLPVAINTMTGSSDTCRKNTVVLTNDTELEYRVLPCAIEEAKNRVTRQSLCNIFFCTGDLWLIVDVVFIASWGRFDESVSAVNYACTDKT
jgi:hypothetical protein